MFLILWSREEKGTGGLEISLPVPPGSLTMHLAMTLFSFHPGEFGEVYRGSLRTPSQGAKTVAIIPRACSPLLLTSIPSYGCPTVYHFSFTYSYTPN